jgi:hypothetical protein
MKARPLVAGLLYDLVRPRWVNPSPTTFHPDENSSPTGFYNSRVISISLCATIGNAPNKCMISISYLLVKGPFALYAKHVICGVTTVQKPEVVKMTLALPADIRRWIEAKAAADLLTMNGAIVRTLRQRMQAEQREAKVD